MNELIALLTAHPKIAAAFSIVFVLACGTLTVTTAIDTFTADKAPTELTIAGAADAADARDGAYVWVILSDGTYDCDTLQQSELSSAKSTELFLVDDSKSIVIIADFNKLLTCDEITATLPASGFMKLAKDGRLDVIKEQFKDDLARYGSPARIYDLCTTCSKGNSQGLMVFFGIMTLVSASVYPLVRYLHNRSGAPNEAPGDGISY